MKDMKRIKNFKKFNENHYNEYNEYNEDDDCWDITSSELMYSVYLYLDKSYPRNILNILYKKGGDKLSNEAYDEVYAITLDIVNELDSYAFLNNTLNTLKEKLKKGEEIYNKYNLKELLKIEDDYYFKNNYDNLFLFNFYLQNSLLNLIEQISIELNTNIDFSYNIYNTDINDEKDVLEILGELEIYLKEIGAVFCQMSGYRIQKETKRYEKD